ncbi:MAG: hypothetical protein WD934_05375 [Gemmatimonadales bacterium]
MDDPEARLRLDEAGEATRHRTRHVLVAHMAEAPLTCSVVVSDLQPFKDSLAGLESLRRTRQGIPILLYLPVTTGADGALHQAIAMGIDGLIFQRSKSDERSRLTAMLEKVLATGMIANLLDQLAAAVPRRSSVGFRVLKHYGIKMARNVDPSDHFETVILALDTSHRTLHRHLQQDGWPGPKELLDWMMLFLSSLNGQFPTDRATRRRVQRAADRLLDLSGLEEPPDTAIITAAFLQSITPAP